MFLDSAIYTQIFNFTVMAKTRSQKAAELATLQEKYAKAKSVAFVHYLGLKVNDAQDLRRKLRAENCELVVAKKTLIAIMAENAGLDKAAINSFTGDVGIVFSNNDEVSAAKVIAEYGKKQNLVSFHGGVLEGKIIDAKQMTALSAIPSRQELLAKMLGSLNAPLSGFVTVLNGNIRGLVQTLSQISEKKSA